MERKFTKMALAATSLAIGAKAEAAITINEVYGGGGSAATTGSYSTDFVELYNNATVAVDLGGFTVKYGSATGAFSTLATSANNFTIAGGSSIPALGFFLVAGATSATFGGAALPTADAAGTFSAAASAGKFELLDTASAVVDLIAYGGTAATGGEGASAAALSTTLSASRIALGVDTNNNSLDFVTGTPSPMNAAFAVPEPTTLGLTAAAGIALFIGRRRRMA